MILVFLQVVAFSVKTSLSVEVAEGEPLLITVCSIALAISAFTFLNSIFTYIFFNMQTLSTRIMALQLEDDQQYKLMFGALKDSLMLVKNRTILFKNEPAAKIIGNSTSQPSPDEINLPLFYKFVTGS
mmetsp:Transcript_10049/g.15322  ORF Transcript_10049/g.15322 Transcript_10049/m.15322 type:complete len:128 (+) Transcript_10049:729-1112(+)